MNPRWAFGVAVADTVLAGAGARPARLVTKPALVPAIAAAVGGRPSRPLAVALTASWAGDVALLGRSDSALFGGIGAFAVAHAGYLTAIRRRYPAPADPAVAATAVAVAAGTGAVLWRRLDRKDPRRLPILGYTALVVTMGAEAVRAARHHRVPALAAGGALFVLSDALVATTVLSPRRRPVVDAAVMATYAAAQALLATALSGPVAQSRSMAALTSASQDSGGSAAGSYGGRSGISAPS